MPRTTYNVRLLHESNALLELLIATGELRPTPAEQRPGTQGTLYAPSTAVITNGALAAVSDLEFRCGSVVLKADVYALPPEEYQGLVLSSPAFQQPDLTALVAPLLTCLSKADERDWVRQLIASVDGGLHPTSTAQLVAAHIPVAHWLPEQTRLSQQGPHWVLCLSFELPDPVALPWGARSAVGLDLGIKNALAVAAFKGGAVYRAHKVMDIYLDDVIQQVGVAPHLVPRVQAYRNVVQQAAARQELHTLLDVLLTRSSHVVIEDLTYRDTVPKFQYLSRVLGLRLFLNAWLPQRLQAQGLSYSRVDPSHTSQLCNLTYQPGQRSKSNGQMFTNGNRAIVDADENAARNILDLGLAQQLRSMRR